MAADEQYLNAGPMRLTSMTKAGHEHAMPCVRLVHTNVLHIAPQGT